jgi:autotransporter-associated beta strand protein
MNKRTKQCSLALAVAITLAANRPAHALTITPIFGSSITSDPNALTIESSINSVIAMYETQVLNPVNVTVTFQLSSTGLGSSTTFLNTDTYTDFLSKLTAAQTSASDATALAHLPVQATNPVNGNANIEMSTANARALGIFTGNSTIGGTIYLNTSIMNLTRSSIDPNKYDLMGVVQHEMDEILGMTSALPNGTNGQAAPTGPVHPQDLFRYDQNGNRSFNTGTDAQTQAYFSIDGTTHIARFNQTSDATNSGDFGDWYSFNVAHTPQAQDAFATKGAIVNIGTAEKTELDVIGYNLLTSLTWNPTSASSGTPPDGAGTWTTASGSTWWNGSSNSVWSNASVQNAQFGTPGTPSSTAYTVTLGSGVTVGEMIFGNANYTIAGGGNSLTLNNGIIAAVGATISAPVILGGNNTWETASGVTLTASGNISGSFGLTKQGPGTLALSGSNSYTGGTTVALGTMLLNSSSALPTSGNVTVSGGVLDIHGQSPTIGNLTFGDGAVTTSGSVIDSGAVKGTMTLGGDITYVGTFNGGFTYYGPATISANMQLAPGTHHITSADPSVANAYDIVISGAMSGTGGLTKDGANTYTALTGANTYSGATVINGGWFFGAATNTLSPNSAVTVNSGGVLSLNPTSTQAGVTAGSYNQTIGSLAGSGQVNLGTATLTVGGDNTSTTFSGGIFDSGNLTKTGTGTLTFTTSQSYTGVTTINNGSLQLGNGGSNVFLSSSGITGLSTGTLVFNSSSNPLFTTPISGGVNVSQIGTGVVFMDVNNTYTGTTNINAGGSMFIGNNDTNGSLGIGDTTNNGTLRFQRTDMLTVSSVIGGTGAVQQNSSGGVIFTGNNTFTGQLTIFAGTVQLGNGGTSGTLASGTTVMGNSGTTLVFNRSDAFTLGSTLGFSNLSVTQNGTGTTTLSATNTYVGATTINAGTLLVTGSISGSTTTVNNSGTLAGSGATGAVNVASGGSVLPGSSTGSGLLNTKSVSFASGSHFKLELGGTAGTNTAGVAYSELKVTGTVSLSGDVQISLFGGYTPQINDTFFIILNDGSDAISGTFSNAAGGTFTSAGYQFQVNYAANGDGGGTANDVSIKVIAAVPEPGTGALLLGGGALLGWRRRRRA